MPTVGIVPNKVQAAGVECKNGRPWKRARTSRPKEQFSRFAATALAGALIRGVGVFAVLVASAL
jgi:hypothetical protein